LAISLVDLRHGPSEADLEMASYLEEVGIPYWVVATKADKLSKTAVQENLASLEEVYADYHPLRILGFSSKTKLGREVLVEEMTRIADGETNE